MPDISPDKRKVYVVLSAHAAPYAELCIRTLIHNAIEDVELTLILDEAKEFAVFQPTIDGLEMNGSQIRMVDKVFCDDLAAETFKTFPNLKLMRAGHPCWRKVTDPYLLSAPGDEIIILDPDLYFPNAFTFEATPERGVLLMHQGPTCLFPPDAVRRVFDKAIPLADHVDIGVAQLSHGSMDLEWLNWMFGETALHEFPDYMHIEAILWSALMMRVGGGYYDRDVWRCWERGYIKRLLVAAGLKGEYILKLEPLDRLKCIHVSGKSKWWAVDAEKKGTLRNIGNRIVAPSRMTDPIELTRSTFAFQQSYKTLFGLRKP